MTRDDQARQRLVEIALYKANGATNEPTIEALHARQRARFRDPSKGSWNALGLTAAMEDAGLLVPAPGTPARRGAIALLDFVSQDRAGGLCHYPSEKQIELAQPGDIIAWLQHPPQSWTSWRYVEGQSHLFLGSSPRSVCTLVTREMASGPRDERCPPCVWYTRQGHAAVIVATDIESITTVGWNEGPSPGRVMMRRLWRDPDRPCAMCAGSGRHHVKTSYGDHVAWTECRKTEPRSSTVLWRRPGGLYGIARPVAA